MNFLDIVVYLLYIVDNVVYLNKYICSAQSKNRYNSGIVLRKVGILTLSVNSGIVPGNSRIAQGVSLVYRLGVRPCAKWE